MKQLSISIRNGIARLAMAFCTILLSIAAMAQDKKIEVDINTKSDSIFFASPWVWVVGVAVFILLLVALMRGGSRREA